MLNFPKMLQMLKKRLPLHLRKQYSKVLSETGMQGDLVTMARTHVCKSPYICTNILNPGKINTPLWHNNTPVIFFIID